MRSVYHLLVTTMVKKPKDDVPNVNATSNRDIIQRLNFLYQASVYLQSIEPLSTEGKQLPDLEQSKQLGDDLLSVNDKDHSKASVGKQTALKSSTKTRRSTHKLRCGDLARSYVQCMRIVGQKTTVKM